MREKANSKNPYRRATIDDTLMTSPLLRSIMCGTIAWIMRIGPKVLVSNVDMVVSKGISSAGPAYESVPSKMSSAESTYRNTLLQRC
jgi:hypothetical protein